MDTPVPISNTEVKHFNGENSLREDSKLPTFFLPKINACVKIIIGESKKMRKLRKIWRFIFLICVFSLIAIIIKEMFFTPKNKNEKESYNKKEEIKGTINNSNETINYKDYIISKSENNPDIVEEYLANGMKESTFINVLNRESNYIKVKNKYKPISYNFENHYKYEELSDLYKSLATSEIVNLEVIGHSVDGREIYSIEIGNGQDKVMIEGNIHAAEIAPTLFLTKFAIDLVNEWESGSEDIKTLLKNHKIVIVPSVNPDGYNYSIFGKEVINSTNTFIYKNNSKIEQEYFKANLNGIDINRNMPSQLSGLYLTNNDLYYTVARDKSTKRLEYFAGYEVGSEPETQALIYWMYKHYKDSHAYLALHSAGRVIYNGKPHLSDKFNDFSNDCAEIVNEKTGYTILGLDSEVDGDGTDGTSTDMIAEIVHGYKFSIDTGRLSTSEYDIQATNMTNDLCVLTIETLNNYTQNLVTIHEEYNRRKLREAIIAIVEHELSKN